MNGDGGAVALLGLGLGYFMGLDRKGKLVEVDPSEISKRDFYRFLTLDMSVARNRVPVTFSGDNIQVYQRLSATPLAVQLNRVDVEPVDLNYVDQIRCPFTQFYLTNAAGAGSMVLFLGSGCELELKSREVLPVGTPFADGNLLERVEYNPTSFTDPDTAWTDEAKAYDGDLATYAYGTGANHYIIFNYAGGVLCDGVRLYCADNAFVPANVNFTIEVYYGGAYHSIWSGTLAKQTWHYLPIGSMQTVTMARLKSTAIQPLIYEFQFVKGYWAYTTLASHTVAAGTLGKLEGYRMRCTDRTLAKFQLSVGGTVVFTNLELGGNDTDYSFDYGAVRLNPGTVIALQGKLQGAVNAWGFINGKDMVS